MKTSTSMAESIKTVEFGHQTMISKFSKVTLDPAAQIYVDNILPRFTCSHFKKQKGFNETMSRIRDHSHFENSQSFASKTRFTDVRK